jgi:hypothetical protein
MSWDSIETQKTCPCGDGTYVVIDRIDDWGRTETNWHMNCQTCQEKYSLYTYYGYDSGPREQRCKWVETTIHNESVKLKKKAETAKHNAAQLAKERYFPVLEKMFEKSSKKAIWKVLNKNIKQYKSLGTFYTHTKSQEKCEYLAALFDDSDLFSILKIANAEDKDIEKLLNDSSALESKSEALLHK